MFETLAQRLDSVYAQMDLVFAETGFADSQSAIREGQVKTDAQGRIFLEVLDCNIVPFGLHATSAGVWKLLSLSSFEVANGTYQVSKLLAMLDTIGRAVYTNVGHQCCG